MDANLARYLSQQRELGTDEVVLSMKRGEFLRLGQRTVGPSEGTLVEAPGAREGARDPGMPRGHAGDPTAVPSVQRSVEPPTIDDATWRKNPPPIPGPGLTIEAPPASAASDALRSLTTLEAVAELIAGCVKCELSRTRNLTVPGEGNPEARLMFVGEGPGATEDQTGRPFVGQAGDLLNKILGSIGIERQAVFIANIVKCRPPQNRKPLPGESAACIPYLHRQIALVRPKVLVALGGTAAESLLGVKKTLGDLRNKVHRYHGIPLVVTYHPAALLRNPNWKKPTWDDVRIARQLLDL
ncbi:MAG: uracil-DNA glycosylase [Gemmatimonadota bacterium]